MLTVRVCSPFCCLCTSSRPGVSKSTEPIRSDAPLQYSSNPVAPSSSSSSPPTSTQHTYTHMRTHAHTRLHNTCSEQTYIRHSVVAHTNTHAHIRQFAGTACLTIGLKPTGKNTHLIQLSQTCCYTQHAARVHTLHHMCVCVCV